MVAYIAIALKALLPVDNFNHHVPRDTGWVEMGWRETGTSNNPRLASLIPRTHKPCSRAGSTKVPVNNLISDVAFVSTSRPLTSLYLNNVCKDTFK